MPEQDGSSGERAGDDAGRLLASLQEWARRTMPEPPSGHGGPECQWCPLCQFASILRGENPEVSARLADAGNALVGAFRAVLDAAATRTPTRDGPPAQEPIAGVGDAASDDPSAAAEGTADKPRPSPRVQRIHLDDGA